MSSRPTDEQLEGLSAQERFTFRVTDFLAKPELAPLSSAYTTVVMGAMIWSCGGRRLNVVGLEELERFDQRSSFVLVANHRSFFDFFVISAVLYWRTNLSKRMFYPTRGNFFYDAPLGLFVNLAMSAGRMFPPVMRESHKRSFNRYALDRCVDELRVPGTILAVHPEGTRNKGPDPYAFLPAQPGAGRLALAAPKVVPAFILGVSNSLGSEFVNNWTSADDTPIDVYFGPPIDLEDLRGSAHTLRGQKRAADRCMDAIGALAQRQREARGR